MVEDGEDESRTPPSRRGGSPRRRSSGSSPTCRGGVDDLVNGKLPDTATPRGGFGFRDRPGPPAAFADPAA